MRHIRAQITLIALLFVGFAVLAYYMEERAQEITDAQTASSHNALRGGTEALYLLLGRLGMKADRLQASYNALTERHGLLIVAEPLERLPGKEEIKALARWVRSGNAVLYIVAPPARPLDPADPLFGDVAVVGAPIGTSSLMLRPCPFTYDVRELSVTLPDRLQPAAKTAWISDAYDSRGSILIERQFDQGMLLATAGIDLSNSQIATSDNAIMMTDIARQLGVGKNRKVIFDEFHHGIGFDRSDTDSPGTFSEAPVWIKLGLLHLLALAIVAAYNANHVLGRGATAQGAPSQSRGEFVYALARLFARARAADAALLILYREIKQDLAVTLGLAFDASIAELERTLAGRFPDFSAEAAKSLRECGQMLESGPWLPDQVLAMAARLEEIRRRCELVRYGA